jgi:hypothetical protein
MQHLNFAISSASAFWHEVCVPSHSQFFKAPSRSTAIQAAWPTWHVHEWIWHEKTHAETLQEFRKRLLADCEQLAWLSDVTDASKHCGLRRSLTVTSVTGTGLHTTGQMFDQFGNHTMTHSDPLVLEIDRTPHQFSDVLRSAIEYWRTKYFG